MRSPISLAVTRRRSGAGGRLAGIAAVGALLLAACGGGSDSATSTDTQPVADVAGGAADGAGDSTDGETAGLAAGSGHVDLVGPDVISAAEIETNRLPSVVLDNVSTGEKVNFRNLVPQEKPILLWMYAPYCPTCNLEAPDVDQFARDHQDELIVVGLGTQDDLGEAGEFVEKNGTNSFTMLWDESYETWQEMGITSQPSAILLAADGTPITGWVGPFPKDDVLELAAESTASA